MTACKEIPKEGVKMTDKKRYLFNEEGVTALITAINDTTDEVLDNTDWDSDTPYFELTIANHAIMLPVNADNINALIYTLLDMFISEQTGEATTGNTKVTERPDIDKLFQSIITSLTEEK